MAWGASMKVSGWVRVWIVASVIWWAGGAVWISRVNFSGEVMPSLWYTMPGCYPDCEMALIARDREYWGERWEYWLRGAWESGGLPLLFFGPFILGALMLGVSWVARGFRPQPAKSVADANKPPPVGPSPSDGV
jgi:hypothetical protein